MKKERSSDGKWVIIALLSLIIIGMGSFAGFYLYNKSYDNPNKEVEKAYVDIGETTVKLSDKDDNRYIKLNLSVGYEKGNEKAKRQLKKDAQLPVVQDAVNFFVMSKDADYFNGNYEKEFKESLINAINEKTQDFQVIDVKISNIIIQ